MNATRRARRLLRFEGLEQRELLSAAPAPAAEVRAARSGSASTSTTLVLRGSFQGVAIPGTPLSLSPPTTPFALFSIGTVGGLGRVRLDARYVETPIHPAGFPVSLLAHVSKGNLSSIDLSLTGTGDALRGGRSLSHPSGPILGASGLFAGASGAATSTLLVNARTHRFSLQVTVFVGRS